MDSPLWVCILMVLHLSDVIEQLAVVLHGTDKTPDKNILLHNDYLLTKCITGGAQGSAPELRYVCGWLFVNCL